MQWLDQYISHPTPAMQPPPQKQYFTETKYETVRAMTDATVAAGDGSSGRQRTTGLKKRSQKPPQQVSVEDFTMVDEDDFKMQ